MTDTGSEPGTQKFGTYRLLRRIAVGGMAEIYLAVARGIGGFEKRLVLKMIHPKYSESDTFIRMLIEEAKLVVQLTHQNVAQVFDLGRIDGTYFIAMEFVEGCDLFHLLKTMADRGDRLTPSAAAFVCHEVATGLDYAHTKNDHTGRPLGIVHRDVSPQNVLLSCEGDLKIVDFGIAKARSRMQETEAGVIKGKYYYMSPEQAKGGDLDSRTDVYSLGIVLWEMLAGRMCFLEENHNVLMDRVRRADVPPITRVRPDVHPQLAAIAMTAVRSNPDERYQTAAEMAAELGEYLLDAGDFNRVDLVRIVKAVVGNGEEEEEEDTTTEDFPAAALEDVSRSENSLLFRMSEVAQAVERIAPAAVSRGVAAKAARLSRDPRDDLPPPDREMDLKATLDGRPLAGLIERGARGPDGFDLMRTLDGGDSRDAGQDGDEATPVPLHGAVPELDDRPDDDATVVDQQAVASALVEVRRQQAEILGFQAQGAAASARQSPEEKATFEWPAKAASPEAGASSGPAPVLLTVRAGSGPKPEPAPVRRDGRGRGLGGPITSSPILGVVPALQAPTGNTEDIPTSTYEPYMLGRPTVPDAPADMEHATWVQEPREPGAGADDEGRATIQQLPSALGSAPVAVGVVSAAGSTGVPTPAPAPALHAVPAQYGGVAPAPVAEAPGPSALRTALIALLLAVLVAGALAAGFFAMRYLSRKPVPSTPVGVGSVRVTSEPRKAQVLLDGVDVKEKTPMVISRVSAGKEHELEVRLKYFEPWKKKIRLGVGEEAAVAAKLVPIMGVLEVLSTPSGSELFVNGEAKGVTPAILPPVPIWRALEIEVRHEDLAPAKRTVAPGDWPRDLKLSVKLELGK